MASIELMHPALYVSLVNVICATENWTHITKRLSEFEDGAVDCCSAPVMSLDNQADVATQIKSWWQSVEQRSLVYSLEFSHILHTDVTDCYGLYIHTAFPGHSTALKKPRGKKGKTLFSEKKSIHTSKQAGTDRPTAFLRVLS